MSIHDIRVARSRPTRNTRIPGQDSNSSEKGAFVLLSGFFLLQVLEQAFSRSSLWSRSQLPENPRPGLKTGADEWR
jgi:hypothetical protein